MTAPAVGHLTPADLPVGTVLVLTGIGNNRRAERTLATITKVGRKLITVGIDRGNGRTFDAVLRLDSQCENGDFAGWSFRTAEQEADDVRRVAARERLRAYGVAFVDSHRYAPANADDVPVDLAEALADAADAWAATR